MFGSLGIESGPPSVLVHGPWQHLYLEQWSHLGPLLSILQHKWEINYNRDRAIKNQKGEHMSEDYLFYWGAVS